MSNSLDLSIMQPAGSLATYIQLVNRVPMLEAEEETDLARRYHDQGDLEAARRLVLSHLRFVVRVAKGYGGYGLPQSDLIQEGTIGLMKAVKRFDPEVGVRLVSYAVHWVRAEIHEYILRNWRIVKVATTKAQRKLFFNLRSAKKRLGWMNHAEVEAVAKDLGVKSSTVLEMEQRLSARDPSFDLVPDGDGDGLHLAPVQQLQDRQFQPEDLVAAQQQEQQQSQQLTSAMDGLDARSREIILRRWLGEKKSTLKELAEHFGVSAERIRQIEKRALLVLRETMDESLLLTAPS